MRCTLLTLLLAAMPLGLPAQTPGPGPGGTPPINVPIYPHLTKYLELKADQILELGRINIQWRQYLNQKARRVADVERELREITLAETVDAPALGVRYAELEAICREARETDQKAQAEARKVLNDAQLAKAGTLEQAYALLPVVGEADAAHLVNAPLPGLNMAGVAAAAASKGYPGCRFAQPPAQGTIGIVLPGAQ